jgi:hypothetical protein
VRPFQNAVLLSAIAFFLMPVARIWSESASLQPDTPRIVSRVDNSVLTTIPGSTHPAVRNATDNGRLASTEPMTDLILVLQPSAAQQAALKSFNAQQYDPTSPLYHQWLTPAEFGATYGVSETDIETVTNWLQNLGFTIDEIPPSHTSIRFSGNVGQVENAFHTEMHSINSKGVTHIANTSDISIPTALTPVVVGVKSLHNFFAKAQHHALSATGANAPGASALSTAPGAPRAGYAPGDGYQLLVPYDLATIYNYKSLWTAAKPINGTGQTVAIAGTSNIVLSDVATFRSATGLPANVPKVIVTNTDPGTTNLLDDRFENTLDVEWSGAAAPGASIVLVTSSQTSQTTDALYASESYIINSNVAKVMSVSYGECELGMGTAGNQEYNNLWQQAYTQGIAVFVSSGDSMAAVCDDGYYNPGTDYAAEFGLSVSGMTSTPYNVSVGGTDFNSTSSSWSGTNNSANMSNATGYIPEVPWNDTITNPILIASFNGQLGVNYSAEQWANYLLKNDGIDSGLYDEVIPPTGGSGGVSNCTTSNGSTPSSCSGGYAKPSWQTGVTGILSTDKRTVPDVSLFASNGFLGVTYLICDTQPPGFSSPISCSYPANALDMAVGGTSVSSPVMAGVMALINQKAGVTQGNPNPVLYALAAKQSWSGCSTETTTGSSSCYFNDVDTGTIAPVCYGGTTNCTPQTSGDVLGMMPGYAATAGYDKATGLGSLNVANVVNGWPSTATTSPAPAATLSTTSLTFSSTAINASSATQSVTLTNSGTASMTLTGVSISGNNPTSFTQTNTCGATLAVSASCAITVTFKPAATGALTATLSFADNAANSPQTVALSGAVVGAVSVSITPGSLTFPSTAINTASASQTVTFTNTGTSAVTFTGSPSTTGAYNYLFKGATSCGGTAALAAGSSCVVTFTFNPTAAGTFSATLNFYDTAPNSPQTATLTGTGAGAPAVSLSTTSLTFSSTNIGSTSAAQTVTLKNTGAGALTISSVSITGASASSYTQSNTCGTSLAASASCTFSLAFQPTAVGTASATLSIADNASSATQTIALTGTGVGAPVVSLSTTSLTFASTNVGSTSAAQSITLKNTGTGALTISSLSFTGSSASSYTQTNTCGTSLGASASCAISITFKPTAAGAAAASLSIADNASNTAQTVTLSGTGVGIPVVSLSPTSLAFASTLVGSQSAAQTVTLKNTGTAALTISSFSITGSYASSFAQTNTCGTSLAVSASCTISVTFKPTAGGSLTASLSLNSNATNSPQSVALAGTGVVPVPVVTLSTAALSFPVTAVNPSVGYAYSPAQAVTLTNSGTAALNLTSITLSGINPTSFTEINNCPASLAVSATCTILTRSAPTVLGNKSATLVFNDNASPAMQSITLTGTGVSAATITLSTSTLSFGTVTPGTISAAQAVTVTNSSTTTPINLTSIALSGTGAASFVAVNNCGNTLAASSSCIVLVEFTPTAASATSATLTVTANNPSATATIALSGQ